MRRRVGLPEHKQCTTISDPRDQTFTKSHLVKFRSLFNVTSVWDAKMYQSGAEIDSKPHFSSSNHQKTAKTNLLDRKTVKRCDFVNVC